MKKVNYAIHHQVVVTCPECSNMIVEDLGEDDNAEGMELTCNQCGTELELIEHEE